jgi:hypothetical protein
MSDKMSELKNEFPHPLNNEVLNSYLGGHPDYGQLLDDLGATLPTECRVSRFPYAESYSCLILVHEGIVFGAHLSMEVALRLPEKARFKALACGGQPTGLGQEWIAIARLNKGSYQQSVEEQQRLVRIAYDYATELARSSNQTPLPDKVITSCPNCSQKLRAPSNLGQLTLICPKCKQSWLWSPQ